MHKKPCTVVTSLALGKQEQEDHWGSRPVSQVKPVNSVRELAAKIKLENR